jgi:hypothetical protein
VLKQFSINYLWFFFGATTVYFFVFSFLRAQGVANRAKTYVERYKIRESQQNVVGLNSI